MEVLKAFLGYIEGRSHDFIPMCTDEWKGKMDGWMDSWTDEYMDGLRQGCEVSMGSQKYLWYKSLCEIFTIKRILRSFSTCFLMVTTISGTINTARIQSPIFCQRQ